MRAIDATTFRVGDIFAWHPKVEPSRDRSATVQPWAGLKNPFRIPFTSFKSGVNRSLIRRTGTQELRSARSIPDRTSGLTLFQRTEDSSIV